MVVDEKWSSPPDALTAEAKFIVSHKGVENVFTSVYYLGLVPGKCPEAFKFSNGPTSFDEIVLYLIFSVEVLKSIWVINKPISHNTYFMLNNSHSLLSLVF